MPILRFKPAIGGGEEYVYQLARKLVQRGHEVTVLTSDLLKVTPDYVYFLRKENEMDGITIKNFHGLRLIRDYPIVPGVVRELARENADIVHGHGFGYFTADFSALVSRVRSVPFILSTHGFFPLAIPTNRLLTATYVGFSKLTLLRIARRVIASSTFDASLYAQLVNPSKICVVPNGIDVDKWRILPKKSIFRAKHGPEGPIVAAIGRVIWVKGFQYLIQATPHILRDFPEAKIVIAGEDFGHLPKLVQLAKGLEIPKDSIIFTGGLSERKLRELYAAMDIMVVPSVYEPFGIVALEAMACGKPIVATASSGLLDIIKPKTNGLTFKPQDSVGLAKAVVTLLKDSSLVKNIGETNRADVRKYSWDNIADRIESIYNEEK